MRLAPVLDSLKNNSSSRRWYGPHFVLELLDEWEMTRTIRDAQRVVVEKVSEPGDFVGFKPLHRHHKRYRNKQRNRIARLLEYVKLARYLLTLTVDPKRFADDRAALAGLRVAWRKIYYRLGRLSPHLLVYSDKTW